MPSPKRILISGYYGLRNTGDEAVLSAIIQGFRARYADIQITVLSADPEETERTHGVRAVARMSPALVRAAIRECDLFISGGGSLLQDATSFKSLAYYLLVIAEAKRQKLPVMILGQGIGPLRRSASQRLTARALNGVDIITVRDLQSADLLRQIGVSGRIEVTADPTLILNPCPQDEAGRLLAEAGISPGEDVTAVSLRGWPERPGLEEAISKALADLADKLPSKLLLLAMQWPDDMTIARHAARGISPDKVAVQPEAWTAEQMLGVLARCRFVVAMRLHALIFAASVEVPSLGILYDPKVEQFALMTGQEGITLEDTMAGLLPDQASAAWYKRDSLAEKLKTSVPAMKSAADRNFLLAEELLRKV